MNTRLFRCMITFEHVLGELYLWFDSIVPIKCQPIRYAGFPIQCHPIPPPGMPSEPIEAELAYPAALSRAQEEEFRQLEHEGPLPSQTATKLGSSSHSLGDLEANFMRAGSTSSSLSRVRERIQENGAWDGNVCLAVALGSSIITGDLQGPVADLHTTQETVNLSVTCFVIGFGVGPLFFAPLSEVIGRTPIYAISMFFYFIFTMPSALAQNAATLVVARQLAGLAASAPMCNVGGSVADVWAVEDRGLPMAFFSATILTAGGRLDRNVRRLAVDLFVTSFASLISFSQVPGQDWVLFIFTGLTFAMTLFIPETLSPVLLRRKAARLRKETGDDSYRSLGELEHIPFSQTLGTALLRPVIMVFTEPVVLFMSFYLSFVYSLLYLLFFAYPITFAEIRGFSPGMTGVTFVSIIVGISIAMVCMPQQEKLYARVTVYGTFPEARLYPMMVGAIVLPIALFIFAFTGAYSWVNFMGPCVAGALFGFSMILIYVSANSYIVDSYSSYAASAIAAKTIMRSLIGSAVPLYVNQMFAHMVSNGLPSSAMAMQKSWVPRLLYYPLTLALVLTSLRLVYKTRRTTPHSLIPPSLRIPAQCTAILAPILPSDSYPTDRKTSDRYVPGTRPVLLRNATLWTGRDDGREIIRGASILLDQGLIVAVLQEMPDVQGLAKERGLENIDVVDVQGKWVSPGIVDAHSHLGVGSSPFLSGALYLLFFNKLALSAMTQGSSDANSRKAPILPWLRSVDGLNTHDDAFRLTMSGGVTTAQVVPGSANNIGGQAFLMKLRPTAERSTSSMLLEPPGNLYINDTNADQRPRWRHMKHACGENTLRVHSQTRMDATWEFRRAYDAARQIRDAQDAFCKAAQQGLWDGESEFPESLQWESLVDVLRGRVRISTHCYEPVDLDSLMRLTNEFKFPIASIHHATSTYLVPDLIKTAWGGPPAIAIFASDYRPKRETYRTSEFNARILSEHNLSVVIKSDHAVTDSRFLMFEAQQAHYFGLATALALSAVTTKPAAALGVEWRVGLVAEGYDADIVVWDSHPLAIGAIPAQNAPATPNWDKETNNTLAFDGLPPLEGRLNRGLVKFVGVKSLWTRSVEGNGLDRNTGYGGNTSFSVIVGNGKVLCSSDSACAHLDAGDIETVDLEGGSLSPGLTSFGTNLGLSEIEMEPSTMDGAVFDELRGPVPSILGHSVIRAVDGLQFGGRHALLAYRAGVTTGISAPIGRFTRGIAAAFDLGASHGLDTGAVVQTETALHVGVSLSSRLSVSTQIAALRLALSVGDGPWVRVRKASLIAVLDTIRPIDCQQGEIPLVVMVHNADIMATLLMVKHEIEATSGSALRMTFAGALEAHLLAKKIAEANVSVVVSPGNHFRAHLRCGEGRMPGPPLTGDSSFTILLKHGVNTGIGINQVYLARNARFDMSMTQLNSAGMIDQAAALAMASINVERALGLNPPAFGMEDLVAYRGGQVFDMEIPMRTPARTRPVLCSTMMATSPLHALFRRRSLRKPAFAFALFIVILILTHFFRDESVFLDAEQTTRIAFQLASRRARTVTKTQVHLRTETETMTHWAAHTHTQTLTQTVTQLGHRALPTDVIPPMPLMDDDVQQGVLRLPEMPDLPGFGAGVDAQAAQIQHNHTFLPNGILIVNPLAPHPIPILIDRATRAWEAKLANASTSLRGAVAEYTRRYGRAPPQGFDVWWGYVQAHAVQLPDEYDQIEKDLGAFYGVRPDVLQQTQRDWEAHRDSYTIGVDDDGWEEGLEEDELLKDRERTRFRVLNYTLPADPNVRHELMLGAFQVIDLLEEVEWELPEFRAVFSPHDSPNIVSDWALLQEARAAAKAGKHLDPNQPPAHKQGWVSACPPSSPAHLAVGTDELPPPFEGHRPNTAPPSVPGGDPRTRDQPKSFIHSQKETTDPCLHPALMRKHGAYLPHGDGPGPYPSLIPQFSYSVTPLHSDIRTAMPLNWVSDDFPPQADLPWEQRTDERLQWRGSNTGIWHSSEGRWRDSHRIRLAALTSGMGAPNVSVLLPSDDSAVGDPVDVPRSRYVNALFDVAFTNGGTHGGERGRPSNCEPGQCEVLEKMFEWRTPHNLEAASKYKYILDVDGHGWSSRFKRLMNSGSLIFKATTYPEWFSDRVQPWVHFIPVQNSYSDLIDSLVFFRGDPSGRNAHDHLAKKIAAAGQKWSHAFWRKEDMVAYMYRLFLEYGRVMSSDREAMSFEMWDDRGDDERREAALRARWL
ncbi:unnamed protein product [Mycena citricolor]|uniref:Glycosyl transferase CAP10 domain-containing protein n=1 Tax=Mycena citricolor TaxID=2018698 RepID=A0AAD2K2Q8_9AGAR|nr:unnamed protein product [Mycena citricolor]